MYVYIYIYIYAYTHAHAHSDTLQHECSIPTHIIYSHTHPHTHAQRHMQYYATRAQHPYSRAHTHILTHSHTHILAFSHMDIPCSHTYIRICAATHALQCNESAASRWRRLDQWAIDAKIWPQAHNMKMAPARPQVRHICFFWMCQKRPVYTFYAPERDLLLSSQHENDTCMSSGTPNVSLLNMSKETCVYISYTWKSPTFYINPATHVWSLHFLKHAKCVFLICQKRLHMCQKICSYMEQRPYSCVSNETSFHMFLYVYYTKNDLKNTQICILKETYKRGVQIWNRHTDSQV